MQINTIYLLNYHIIIKNTEISLLQSELKESFNYLVRREYDYIWKSKANGKLSSFIIEESGYALWLVSY